MAQDSIFSSFDLAPDGVVPPLDLPALPGMLPSPPPQGPPQAAPQSAAPPNQPQARGQNPLSQLGPMLPLIAAAMKQGGRAGLAGFLQGVQQARARKAEQARLGQQDARTAAQDQRAIDQQTWQRGVQERTLAAQEQERQRQLLTQFQTALGSVDDPEAVRALLELYGPQADAMGVGRQRLETFASQYATPTALQKRNAEKQIKELEQQHGNNWIQIGGSFTYRVPGEQQPITFDELLRRSGRTQTAPLPVNETETSTQMREMLVDGQAAAVFFDPKQRKFFDVNGQDVTTKVRPLPPDRIVYPAAQGGSDPRAIATFNQIAGAYERSPLIRASDRTIVLSDAIKQIEANPNDPAAQLSLAYSYIQALDTYQSAVREGELQNLGVLGTRLQSFMTELNRVVSTGAFLPPEVARNIATNAKQLVTTIENGRSRKEQEFASRARVSGVGEMWDNFVGGFVRPTPSEAPPPPTGRPAVVPPTDPARGRGAGPAGQNPFRRN